jgi:hypothetical protein
MTLTIDGLHPINPVPTNRLAKPFLCFSELDLIGIQKGIIVTVPTLDCRGGGEIACEDLLVGSGREHSDGKEEDGEQEAGGLRMH